MEFKQVLGRRRTIRFFLPYREVERSKIQKMLEAARRASCVGNVNNTRAIVIWKDQASPELIKNITANPEGFAAEIEEFDRDFGEPGAARRMIEARLGPRAAASLFGE